METVNDPRIVAQKFEEASPGLVGLQGQGFFVGLEVYETSSPGKVGEGAPFGRDDRGMIAVFPRPYDAGMFIQGESDLSLESQARAFQNDLGTQF